MALTATTDVVRVLDFVRTLMPIDAVEGMEALGIERDGELVAGVIYEGFSKHNVWMHVAAVPGSGWLNRSTLKLFFTYPFDQMGVRRVSAYVYASNTAACRFDEHLGFKREATLTGAAPDGGDVIIYAMWRKDCRYV